MPNGRSGGWTGWDDGLPVCVDDVMDRWARILRAEPPWTTMPADDLTGEMRGVVIELINARWDCDEQARRHRIATAARSHGAFRQAQRCSANVLVFDFALFRVAIMEALRRGHWSASLARDAIGNLAPDIRLARRAARRGFDGRATEGSETHR